MAHQLSRTSIRSLFAVCLVALIVQRTLGFAFKTVPSVQKISSYQSTFTKLRAAQLQTDGNNGGNFFENMIKSITDSLNSGASGKNGNQKKKTLPAGKSVRVVPKAKVIIIGSGMSGLACAIDLLKAGCSDFLIVDSADAPGGRVRTDEVDGYLLDRGFQVFIDSYPEAISLFDNDYKPLNLKSFWPGALVRYE